MRLPIEDLWPNAESTPVHKPALPAALRRTMTGMLGEVSGATLKRGVYFGSRGRGSSKTRMSLNSKIAVMRPHICFVL